MATFFDKIKRDFKDVPVSADNKISTAEFLEASESLVTLFDLLGSTAFAPVQKDMTGNIKKIRDRLLSSPDKSETLQDLVSNELAEKKHVASEGLLWLQRGLQFTAQAIRKNVDNSTEELSASFTTAYENTLKKHHSFVIRPIFGLAMKATPYRAAFYEKLGGGDQEKVKAQLVAWLEALEKVVGILHHWIEKVAKDGWKA